MKGVEVGWGSHHASNCIKETDGHHRPHHKRRKPSERHESLVKRLHASVAYWWWWPTPTQALRPYLLSPNPLIRLIPISNQIWGIRPYGLSEGTVWELGFKYIEKEPIGNSIMKCGGEPAGMAGPEVRRMSELHMIVVVLDVRTSRPDNIPKGCFDFLKLAHSLYDNSNKTIHCFGLFFRMIRWCNGPLVFCSRQAVCARNPFPTL